MTAESVWTVRAALDWCIPYLEGKGDEHPRRSAEWLLSAATGLSRIELYAFHDRPLTPDERATLREGVRRRAEGEPLQYVTGEVAFRHIVLKVRPGVLIPRPETEILVDEALAALSNVRDPLVADICTGSGCVGLSVAFERPDARVVATDIEQVAVTAARENAERLGLAERFSVFAGDLMAPLPPEMRGRFDAVLANPPYIPSDALPALPAEVIGFEPHIALDGGPDGLCVFRRLIEQARHWLAPGGVILIELDEGMVGKAAQEAVEWYQESRVVRDLTGRDRFVAARLA